MEELFPEPLPALCSGSGKAPGRRHGWTRCVISQGPNGFSMRLKFNFLVWDQANLPQIIFNEGSNNSAPVLLEWFTELARVQTQILSLQHSAVLANSPDVEVDKDGQSGEGRHSEPGQHKDIRQHDELGKQWEQKYQSDATGRAHVLAVTTEPVWLRGVWTQSLQNTWYVWYLQQGMVKTVSAFIAMLMTHSCMFQPMRTKRYALRP